MKTLSISIIALTTMLGAQAAELSSTVGFTNDYRFRGASQTAGDAAIQGSLDLAFDNGIFAGIWGSNVDFGPDANASLEVDYYVGYGGSINEDLTYDATVFYYTYPGFNGVDIDYLELALGLYYKNFSLTYVISDDFLNSSESAQYTAIDYQYPITEKISVDLHAGYSYGDYWDGTLDINEYQDYSIGISGSAYGLDLSAAFLFNSVDSEDEANTGAFRNDDTFLVSVSRTF